MVTTKERCLFSCFHVIGSIHPGGCVYILGGKKNVLTRDSSDLSHGGLAISGLLIFLLFSLGCFGEKGVIPYFLTCFGAAFLGTSLWEENFVRDRR